MLEILLVLLTAVAFQICESVPGAKGPFIVAAVLAWSGYIARSRWRRPEIFCEWGFCRDNLKPAMLASLAVFAGGASGLVVVAARVHGWDSLHSIKPSFWLAMLLYPL